MLRSLTCLLNANLAPKKVVEEPTVSRLLSEGENFGSVMYKLEFIVQDENGDKKQLTAVAKTLPDSEIFRKIFFIQTTYTNEIAFYQIIIPTLQQFQIELGIEDVINCFPKCYATRKNLLNDSDKITDDAVIILENLSTSGFINCDRTLGLDLNTTKLILRDLALLHGVSLAFKLKHPEKFENKIKKFCTPFEPSHQNLIPVLKMIIEEKKELAHLAPKYRSWGLSPRSPINEPIACLIHADVWTNNTMQLFQDDKPIENKFVDFQIYQYGSPAADVFFFLWSSVALHVLESNLDDLLKYYTDQLHGVLKKHECNIPLLTHEAFLKEMESVSEYEFGHAFLFHNLIVNCKKGGQDLENPDVEKIFDAVPLEVKQKSWFMLEECMRRGWFKYS
ncbi:uncharacterized protein LOC130445277 [Diorhabda sublineata]|uniref:uncharacterized protein LOC130445277 n=1 Tax=Diorhabda sublineata TaxID=1163346 RepID=UPI0024E0F4C4|nr:uncharacterized protein LOC130445277 [Diorhabda sublineata]